ncbi:MAG: S-methyl-5-thioribose-1-phosphate isomerase [Calditrichaeota bacterium]|nr:S-methyl-5-thioribose-1-phosphate isomerase [Calditrichota bacterium]
MTQALEWKGSYLRIIDQTRLPFQKVYVDLHTIQDVHHAIRSMQVRGAPVIGITAAYGLYLGVKDFPNDHISQFQDQVAAHAEYLKSARPTAVNLAWAVDSITNKLRQLQITDVEQGKRFLLEQAQALHDDDRRRCEGIAQNGVPLIPQRARILTHCNTGALATGGIGTALGIIYKAHQNGKEVVVYADETRPFLQGARLTVWELQQAGIPVTLICDNMAAWLMKQGHVDLVLVGADRITRHGYVANKIGTYNLAILAHHHKIPFYVAAPISTFDFQLEHGDDIPIEERDCEEIRNILGRCEVAPANTSCWNPAFDVTPPEFVTAIITEAGVIETPVSENIRQLKENLKLTIH